MAVKIGHAAGSETGGREGASGDQTGREVRLDKWYISGDGWGWYIEAKDPALLERMALLMEQACANPNIGYSRTNRYKWYNSAKANGGDVTIADGDCDCSSLVSGIANLAGANVTNKLATASMLNAFKKSGDFNIYPDADHLKTDKYAKRGGIYLRVGHTLMVLENGSGVAADSPSIVTPTPTVKPPYVLCVGNTVNVRTGGSTKYEKAGTVRKGDAFSYLGKDSECGWYMIAFEDMTAFISSNPKYTKLVEE